MTRRIINLIILWIWRLTSPLTSLLLASLFTLIFAGNSVVNEMFSDALFRFPKLLKVFFWQSWYPNSFYYQWETKTGGYGRARWMWRQPKQPNWRAAIDWWVFKG